MSDEIQLPLNESLSYRYDSLYQWMSRKYKLKEEHVIVGSHRLCFYTIADVDELLEQAIISGSEPYWYDIWESALGLANCVFEENLEGKRVLDLGCGVGLTGVVAALKGGEVWMNDVEPDALRLAELNWILNLQQEARLLNMDWRTANVNEQFEVLIASDVLYDPDLFSPLMKVFQKLLTPTGNILLSEPNRPVALPFFRSLEEHGFKFQKTEQEVDWRGRTSTVSVYNIERKS
ncbi:MAG: methyltransferase domain-containing protein [Calditrichaeota bacterium]|nr:MAG: methyltransferase domain-containing protein [Calditrichota bacterium]